MNPERLFHRGKPLKEGFAGGMKDAGISEDEFFEVS